MDYILILYSLILCFCLLTFSLLYILFPENITLSPHISWFVLYLILQAFTNQNATHTILASYYYYYCLHWSFSHQRQLMVFHWSLSDSKSRQVFRTLLSILVVLNNVVWMVSTRPPTSNSSSPFSNPMVNVIIIIIIIIEFCKNRNLYYLRHDS